MKVLKFLSGGVPMFQPMTDPFRAPRDPALTSSSASTKSGDGLISKELLNKLYENGLPNDVDNFLEKVSELEYQLSMGLPIGAGAVRKLEALGNRVIQMNKYMKQAETEAAKNDALGEIAVGSRGELFVADGKSGVKMVNAGSFDVDSMQALTVGELIEARKFSESQAFDERMIPAIGRNLGLSKIQEYIAKIVQTVGNSRTVDEAYSDLAAYLGTQAAKRPTKVQLEQLQGLAGLMEQIGPDAIFKNKQIRESKNMEEAMSYILKVLPQEMTRLLLSRSIATGGSLESGVNNINSIIMDALAATNNTKVENYLNYDQQMNTAAGTKAGVKASTAKEQNRNLGVLEQLVQGSLGKRDFSIISRKSPTSSMTLHGSGVGSLADYNNNIVDKTPLSIAMKTGLASVVDHNHVFIGDQKVPTGAFDTILYDGGDVINVWAPVDGNGDIDLGQLQLFNEVQKVINRNPLLTPQDKTLLLQQYNLDGYFDDQNVFHGGSRMALFLVMTGLTSDEVVDPNENIYADKLSKQDKDLEMTQIDRIYGLLNKGIKNKDQQYKFIKGWFNWSTDLVKAPIFMKLNTTAQIDVGTFSGKGPLVQTPSYASLMAYDQSRYSALRPINTTSSSVLYDE